MATKRLQQLIERTNLRLVDECEGQYLTGLSHGKKSKSSAINSMPNTKMAMLTL